MEKWITNIGQQCSSSFPHLEVTGDSSGVKTRQGSAWRMLKWEKGSIRKTSPLFRKVHIITLPCRAIVAITCSPSTTHDSKCFGTLWKQLSRTLITKLLRTHLDTAYWTENILGLLTQKGTHPIIPPKKNTKDHGTDSPHDKIVRVHQRYPGLYRHNHHTERRASVEHVFGLIKLQGCVVRDHLPSTRDNAILCSFL